MEHYKIAKKLLGKIRPAGDASLDDDRFDNLEHQILLIRDLTSEVIEVASDRKTGEHSVDKAIDEARTFLKELSEMTDMVYID